MIEFGLIKWRQLQSSNLFRRLIWLYICVQMRNNFQTVACMYIYITKQFTFFYYFGSVNLDVCENLITDVLSFLMLLCLQICWLYIFFFLNSDHFLSKLSISDITFFNIHPSTFSIIFKYFHVFISQNLPKFYEDIKCTQTRL